MAYKYTFCNSVGDPPPHTDPYTPRQWPYTEYYLHQTYTTDRITLNPTQDQYKISYRDGFKDGYRTAMEQQWRC